jgi:hypothetical protein
MVLVGVLVVAGSKRDLNMHHNRGSTDRTSSASLRLREGGAASEGQSAGRARRTSERWMAEGSRLLRDMSDGGG